MTSIAACVCNRVGCHTRHVVALSSSLSAYSYPLLSINQLIGWRQPRRYKHKVLKFRWLRAKKVLPVELPDLDSERDATGDGFDTPDLIRRRLKKMGMLPSRYWNERPITVMSTGSVFEPYVPPEGDGRMSVLSAAGAKQKASVFGKKSASYLSVRKIRSFDEDFSTSEFGEKALEIYRRAHQALAAMDEEGMHAVVTELAFPKMMAQARLKTIRWQLVKQLEPARVVHVRQTHLIDKQNVFAQVTVRLHTQQLLAVYDRFGRLMYGSEAVVKDVLEYVVFENHLANAYGRWRLHDKIVPEWMPPREPIMRTWRQKQRTQQEEGQKEGQEQTSEVHTQKDAAAVATA